MSALKIKAVIGQGVFDDILVNADDHIKEISHALRGLLADVMPDITEVPWAKQKIAGYGVGPKKMSEHFCYIAPFKAHVNLGFTYGAALGDPTNILEGGGANMRHIKIRSLHDINNPAIKNLLVQASKHLPKLKP